MICDENALKNNVMCRTARVAKSRLAVRGESAAKSVRARKSKLREQAAEGMGRL
jgi:hypothetical protein